MQNPFILLGIINFFRQLHFYFPVNILIYQAKGVSLGDYFLVQGIYLWAVVLMEIPSGYLGDLFSRRLNLAFSAFLCVAGCLTWFCGYGFWALLAGELLFGFGDAFSSGTSDAYIYDLSEQYGKKNKFHRILSTQTSIEKNGFLFAACSGAFIFQFLGANGTILVTLISYLIAFVLYFVLPDAKEIKRKINDHFTDILHICVNTLKNKELRLIILSVSFLSLNFAVFHWGVQPLMMEMNIPLYMFSIATGATALAWSFWSAIAGKLLEKTAFRGILWISFCLYLVAYILIILILISSTHMPIYLLFTLAAFLSGNRDLNAIASSVLINHRIRSDERSTILSVRGLISSFLRGGILIAIKPLTELIGITNVFFLAPLLLLPCLWFCLKASKQNLPMQKDQKS